MFIENCNILMLGLGNGIYILRNHAANFSEVMFMLLSGIILLLTSYADF